MPQATVEIPHVFVVNPDIRSGNKRVSGAIIYQLDQTDIVATYVSINGPWVKFAQQGHSYITQDATRSFVYTTGGASVRNQAGVWRMVWQRK